MTNKPQQRLNGLYPWIIVAAVSICCIIWSGTGYFVFSVFVKPLQVEFGWDRSTIMTGFLVWSMTVGFAAILSGRAVDRYRPRRVIVVGAIITVLGFFCLSLIQNRWHFYLSYVVVGIGNAGMGQVPCSAVVSEWFDKKRGLAMGIMSAGVGLGGLVFLPLTGGLLIPAFGWRQAYLIIGVIACLVTLPLAAFIIRSKKISADEYRLYDTSKNTNQNKKNNTLKQYLTSPLLWLIAGSFFFSQFGLSGTIQNLIPQLSDVGFSSVIAASILGMLGLVSGFAKIFFGWLCDHIHVSHAFIIAVALQAMGTIILLYLTPETHQFLRWSFIVILGMGSGSWLPVMSIAVSRNFDLKYYGSLFGVVNFCLSLGVATGPLFAGYMFDIYHNYQQAFLIFMGFYAVAILLAFLGKSRTPEETVTMS